MAVIVKAMTGPVGKLLRKLIYTPIIAAMAPIVQDMTIIVPKWLVSM